MLLIKDLDYNLVGYAMNRHEAHDLMCQYYTENHEPELDDMRFEDGFAYSANGKVVLFTEEVGNWEVVTKEGKIIGYVGDLDTQLLPLVEEHFSGDPEYDKDFYYVSGTDKIYMRDWTAAEGESIAEANLVEKSQLL